jgi:cation transport ATPase
MVECENRMSKENEKTEKVLAKYFLHGVAFSFLFMILAILWSFGLFVLIVLGSWIGLIIGVGILMLITGGLNTLLTSVLWFPVKTSFSSILVHGIVLFILLVIVNSIAIFLPSVVFPGTAATIVTFILGSFIDGYVCKQVARLWEGEEYESVPETVEAEWGDKNL